MGGYWQHRHSGVQFEEHQPGCMWGLLNYLDHHHWKYVKKIAPRKKHQRGRLARCCRKPETLSMEHAGDEAQDLSDSKSYNFQVEQHTTETSPTSNCYVKAYMKASNSKEMTRGENHKHWISGFPERSKLQRTYSIHHLEPSDHRLSDLKTGWRNPIIILRKSAGISDARVQVPSLSKSPVEPVASSINQKQIDAKQLRREVSLHQVKEYVDIFEIYKVNKDLFLKILQDQDVGFLKDIPLQQTPNTKVKLTKSGSFPVADSSHVRYLKRSTLEHKQNEIWSLPKGEKFLYGSQLPKFSASKSQKYHSLESPSLADDNSGGAIKQETSFSSQASPQGLHNQWWNQLVINHIKDIKQRIKHVLQESKKKSDSASWNALLEVPYGSTDGNETSDKLKTITMDQDGVDNPRSFDRNDSSDHHLSKGRLLRIRRTASLNESLDRYAQLFENSFSKVNKMDHSKSLKLASEDKISTKGHAPIFSRRISSLSDLESFCSLLNEVSHDTFSSDMPTRAVVDCDSVAEFYSQREQEAVVDTEVQKLKVDRNEKSQNICSSTRFVADKNHEGISEYKVDTEIRESVCHQQQEIILATNPSKEVAEPSSDSVIEACFQDDITNLVELTISEDSELNTNLHIDEPAGSINLKNRSNNDSSSGFCSILNEESVECTKKRVDDHFLQENLDEMDDSDFNYVRDVLELSGFIGNEYFATWHSLEQPLNPSLFKELESYLPHEFEVENGINCYHQLLFDLVNVALVEIYDKSYTYFPKAFSFSRRICPMPKEHHVLEEVWSRVGWYLNSRQELKDQSLDDIAARDMAKGDGWMNLQLEAELMALDLEEMIFDELVDEILCP
ncbi:DUF3741 domain-containing protein/DUF4378 domain-containing protein [Cephalotus follicularis]|uniref:DUF3741 domain-containing protein/DUF4378 domain-containing protein n=1 Tax=Cephalotus follicularis TaxID=3775 RepID=A0A1Q3BLM8_CEPFO|nr:DUF3741 domain-containing protein/DUF4378 domain-containing protein [Cephalotus follicularis]